MAAQPARLCIISREPLRSGHFIAALRAALGPEDHVEIIIDRRHGGSSGEASLTEDRRRQPQVALTLEANGFAIVPASVDPEDRTWRPRPSVLRPDVPPIERASPVLEMPPIERFSPVERLFHVDNEGEEFESIANFERRRPRTLIPALFGVLIGVTLVALVLLLAGQLSGQSRFSQLLTHLLRGGPEQSPGPPVVAETPPPARPDSESPSAGGSASTSSVSPRNADRLTPRPRETNGPSEVTGTASQEPSIPSKETSISSPGASAPANETGAPPQAATGEGARDARPGPSATARPGPSAPPRSSQVAGAPPGAATSTATSTQVVDRQRAELVGAPVSRGWGDSYAVRVLDSAGRPMVGANVLLVARMADGTVENIAMGALTEPGTYRGTVPTNQSTPIDLRVRVTTDGGSAEIPVGP